MIRDLYPLATHCDCRPDGARVVLFPGSHFWLHLGRIPLPTRADGRPFDVLYPRMPLRGSFKFAGQAHVEASEPEAGTWEWDSETRAWTHPYPYAHGTSPVIYDAGGNLVVRAPGFEVDSQGYRYVDDEGDIVGGSATYNDRTELAHHLGVVGLWEWSHYGDITIGQGETGCDVLAHFTDTLTGERRVSRHRLEDGDTHFIRVTHDGDLFAVAIWRQCEREAVLFWVTRAELLMLPAPKDHPPDEPPKKPDEPKKPEESHMEDVSAFVLTHPMQAVLGKPEGPGLELQRCYNALRFIAAVVRDLNERAGTDRWFLFAKLGGDFPTIVDGQGYGGDTIQTRTEYVDIVKHREGEGARPVWGEVKPGATNGILPPSDGAIVRAMGGEPEDPHDPEDPEDPNEPADPELVQRVGLLEAHVRDQDNDIRVLQTQMQMAGLTPVIAGIVREAIAKVRIVGDKDAPQINTNKSYGFGNHSHEIRLKLEP